jgi:hypothetical protein
VNLTKEPEQVSVGDSVWGEQDRKELLCSDPGGGHAPPPLAGSEPLAARRARTEPRCAVTRRPTVIAHRAARIDIDARTGQIQRSEGRAPPERVTPCQAPRRERQPMIRRFCLRRSRPAMLLRRVARAPLPHAHGRASATSHTTTAAGRTGYASPASRRALAHGTSAARSRRDGRPCSTRRRRPCRCAAGCRRHSLGIRRRSAP